MSCLIIPGKCSLQNVYIKRRFGDYFLVGIKINISKDIKTMSIDITYELKYGILLLNYLLIVLDVKVIECT